MKDTFANRLQTAINLRGIKPIELASKTKIDKSLISCYLSGKYKAGDDNLEKLAKELNVSEMWLDGYDVNIDGSNLEQSNSKILSQKEILFNKTKDILSDSDWATIEFIMNKTINEYENQKNNDS